MRKPEHRPQTTLILKAIEDGAQTIDDVFARIPASTRQRVSVMMSRLHVAGVLIVKGKRAIPKGRPINLYAMAPKAMGK